MRISDWSSDVCSSDLVHLFFGVDARLHTLADPQILGAPVNVALGLIDILAAAAEAEHRAAHRFDRDIAGEDEPVGPADLRHVFLLKRPQRAEKSRVRTELVSTLRYGGGT